MDRFTAREQAYAGISNAIWHVDRVERYAAQYKDDGLESDVAQISNELRRIQASLLRPRNPGDPLPFDRAATDA
jgi:hypothetical protein